MSQRSMYVSFEDDVVTFARQMVLRALQFPFMSVELQLQAHFFLQGDFEDLQISILLWLEMMVLTLLLQL